MVLVLGELLAGLSHGLDVDPLHRIQDGIGQALVHLNVVGAEAEHERSTGLAAEPDTGPLLRTMLRLRHDLVMIGRTAISPLPDPISSRLELSATCHVRSLHDLLAALGRRCSSSAAAAAYDMESALDAYATEVAAVRREGLTQNLPVDAVERFFALGFALEQMRNNFKDLQRWVAESAVLSNEPRHKKWFHRG
jgi:hypothetical protein